MGFVLPISICGLGWHDWMGGIVYAGILRMFFFQQGMLLMIVSITACQIGSGSKIIFTNAN